MQVRHLVMLSLGGVIGTGLFFNTGYIIASAGAAGAVLAYLIGALVVYLVMQCLGELAVAMPQTGAFHVYATRYLGPATGYVVAWLYWLTWTVALGSSLTAAAFCMQYWFPHTPAWPWCLLFCALIFALNMVSARWFAEGEFWFSLIKVLAIVAFIVLGTAAALGLLPLADGSPAPGLRHLRGDGWFAHGALPVLMTMVAVNFAFSGTELIGVAAGETAQPARAIPLAIRTTLVRLVVLFVGTVIVLAALLPAGAVAVDTSPFVRAFTLLGLRSAADVMNAVILSAILSAANSGLYAAARMLWSLADAGTLPASLGRLSRRGIPLRALVLSMGGGLLALLTGVYAADTVFVAISAVSGFAVVVVWMSICASHYVFRRQALRAGQLDRLGYRAPWYPWTPILGFTLCLLACIGLAFDPQQRIALWCGLPFVALCYGAYALTQWRTRRSLPT